MPHTYVAPVGLNIIHIINNQLPLSLDKPILEQRRICRFSSSMCKPVIAKEPMTWTTGFHASTKPINIDQHLFLFHLKYMDYSIAFHRHKLTKEMRWAESSLVARHGAHARYEYPQFVREAFLDPLNLLASRGIVEFAFSDLVKTFSDTATQNNGFYSSQHFQGDLMEVPLEISVAF